MKQEQLFYRLGYRISEAGIVMNPKGKVLKGTISNGYLVFSIRGKEKSSLKMSFHRLQSFQKYGMLIYKDGVEVRHKNGDRRDNGWDNILIGTRSENQMDIPESIRISRSLYGASFIRKYKREDVIKFHRSNGNSYKKTMEEFGISSKGTLHFILNKNTKGEAVPEGRDQS